ncbi:hypothetical protein PENNAL_c0025G04163 [Penicillium nalgiovense]|uniref:Uncharacterized protein n=1 Tax=Penicillium nalgiovense TaxID=60175 RepID=A0A1V6YCT0_PENNA|nr:hypothetical protein PENNAL_c0025G04163 [Penicillium nalgiovense]
MTIGSRERRCLSLGPTSPCSATNLRTRPRCSPRFLLANSHAYSTLQPNKVVDSAATRNAPVQSGNDTKPSTIMPSVYRPCQDAPSTVMRLKKLRTGDNYHTARYYWDPSCRVPNALYDRVPASERPSILIKLTDLDEETVVKSMRTVN